MAGYVPLTSYLTGDFMFECLTALLKLLGLYADFKKQDLKHNDAGELYIKTVHSVF